MAGNALANATAARPISRRDACRRVEEFLARARSVNSDDSWLYRVGKVVIFGSYLNDQDRIGDIDLAIRLERRVRVAEDWAENEVKRYLRGGARCLSLHDWTTEEPWLEHAPHQVLLDDGHASAPVNDTTPKYSDLRITSKKAGSGAHRTSRRPAGCPF